MTYSKYNVIYRLQKWMDSVAGQTFLNYAYSWGASVVILGTLFKLTHLPGANFFLFLGMGTEVFVFFISAFDRPFDKTTDGMNLTTQSQSTQGEYATVSRESLQGDTKKYEQALNEVEKVNDALSSQNDDLEKLHSTLNGIRTAFEAQLKRASEGLRYTKSINDEQMVMLGLITELRSIYARMIAACKVG